MTGALEVHGGCDADHCAGRATNGVVFFGSKEKGWPRNWCGATLVWTGFLFSRRSYISVMMDKKRRCVNT